MLPSFCNDVVLKLAPSVTLYNTHYQYNVHSLLLIRHHTAGKPLRGHLLKLALKCRKTNFLVTHH